MQITDAEWEVMECIWGKKDQTPAEIIERVQPLRDRSHRTIRTLLNRLVDKGAVTVRAEGTLRLYNANVTRNECVMQAAKSFGERFFGGSLSSMLMHFVESEEISASEAEELRKKLDEITQSTNSPSNKTPRIKPKRGK